MTREDELTDELRQFLRERVRSYEALEVLLVLYSAEPTQSFTAAELSSVMRVPLSLVDDALATLEASGLATRTGPLTLSYRRDDAERLVQQLAHVCETRRIDVMRAMSEDAIGRMRTSAMRAFADAFVVREKKEKS